MIDRLYNAYLKAGSLISTDTRRIAPGSLFFALKGDRFDGNAFAHEAIKNGASAAVIDNPKYKSDKTFLVDDSLKALQQLSTFHRKKSNFRVFGLTGSNGKTTTKELIYQVLSKKYKCQATKGNLNNHIGVPLTLLTTPSEAEILVVEMGANHVGEIRDLCEICQPDYGLITNIGKAHIEGFGGFQGVLKAKTELYRFLEKNQRPIFLNSNDSLLAEQVEDYKYVFPFGGRNTDVFELSTSFHEGLTIDLNINGKPIALQTKLFGEYNVVNIMTAVKVGIYFQVPVNQIADAIKAYVPQNHRSQIVTTEKNTLILDSYNANPSSMKAALTSFKEINAANKILILGSMKELGETAAEEHKQLIDLAQSLSPKQILAVGEEFKDIMHCIGLHFNTTNQLMDFLQTENIRDALILIKGSRVNALERIIDYL
jgi:UDP-N-acetylmuramoyl-tripeptide--D-alanyl-D-alanine ligase